MNKFLFLFSSIGKQAGSMNFIRNIRLDLVENSFTAIKMIFLPIDSSRQGIQILYVSYPYTFSYPVNQKSPKTICSFN
jgi:hypothetical protein